MGAEEADREYVDYVSARLPSLHRAAYLLCGDRHRADDVVQATITTVYLKWRKVKAADDIDAYVHRILVRRYLDDRRLAWSRVLLTSEVPDRPIMAEHSIENRQLILDALAGLPRGQRAILVLRYFCDLSVEATAAAVGCSIGNVKSQTSRGLAALRQTQGLQRSAA